MTANHHHTLGPTTSRVSPTWLASLPASTGTTGTTLSLPGGVATYNNLPCIEPDER